MCKNFVKRNKDEALMFGKKVCFCCGSSVVKSGSQIFNITWEIKQKKKICRHKEIYTIFMSYCVNMSHMHLTSPEKLLILKCLKTKMMTELLVRIEKICQWWRKGQEKCICLVSWIIKPFFLTFFPSIPVSQ